MVICFNCSPQTKETLERLVATGGYRDSSDVISAAIENLAVIHDAMHDRTAVVVTDDTGSGTDVQRESASEPKSAIAVEPGFDDYAKSHAVRRKLVARPEPSVPPMFRRPANVDQAPRLAVIAHPARSRSTIVPIQEWIFGQFNRLLPVKASCRALVNIGKERVPLAEVATKIADEAVKLGNYLSGIDETRNANRDEAMAVAFPRPTFRDFKSIDRFASQFVGVISKEGQITGLPAQLSLIAIDPEFPEGVLLTEAGWRFALFENPLLNGAAAEKPTDKFTPAEIEFLLGHIASHVPAEAYAYRTILSEVQKGAVTPRDLDKALAKLSKSDLQPSFLSTQRSGAISRMTDLDLIVRKRNATRVSYHCTPRGQNFISSKG